MQSSGLNWTLLCARLGLWLEEEWREGKEEGKEGGGKGLEIDGKEEEKSRNRD